MSRRYQKALSGCTLALCLVMVACAPTVSRNPVPVTHLGLNVDSRAGAVMVRRGDTVSAIAQRYRLNLRDIIDTNNLLPPYHLKENQRLLLPAPAEHKVGRNDTLLRLSHMYDVSISEMVRLNNLSAPYRIETGQVLRVPTARAAISEPEQQAGENVITALPKAERPVVTTPAPRPLTTAATQPTSAPKWSSMSLKPLNGVRGDFAWPVKGKVISKYGPKTGGLFNDGLNIAAAKGTPVTAAASGTVVYVGNELRSYGNIVLVRHPGGFVTAYSHLGDIAVKRGVDVSKGQKIGTVGSTGTVAEPQLHFEIRKGSQTYDPVRFLGG